MYLFNPHDTPHEVDTDYSAVQMRETGLPQPLRVRAGTTHFYARATLPLRGVLENATSGAASAPRVGGGPTWTQLYCTRGGSRLK